MSTYKNRPKYLKEFDISSAGFSAGDVTSIFFPKEQFVNEFEVSWDVYGGGRIWGNISLSRLQSYSMKLQFSQAQNDGIYRLFKMVIDIYDFHEQEKILKQSESIQKEYLELTLRKARSGNVSSYEVSQAQADYFSYSPRMLNIQLRISQLEIELKKTLGRSAQMTPQMQAQIKPQTIVDKIKMLDRALAQRLDLKINKIKKKIVKAKRGLLFSSNRPQVTVSAALGFRPNDFDDIFEGDYFTHNLSLRFHWNIFDGGAILQRLRISAAQQQAFDKEYQGFLNALGADVERNYQMKTSLDQLYSQTEKWQKETQRALDQAQKSYQIGKVSQLEWIQLQKTNESAQLAFSKVKIQVMSNELERQWVVGQNLKEWAQRVSKN